jgi:hypothetical protein
MPAGLKNSASTPLTVALFAPFNAIPLAPVGIIITLSFAGTGKSVGTAGGTELLIPTGAKGIALNGANNATVSGVDALFFNPAGISNLGSGVETQFSNTNYIADIGMSYLALASRIEKYSSIID